MELHIAVIFYDFIPPQRQQHIAAKLVLGWNDTPCRKHLAAPEIRESAHCKIKQTRKLDVTKHTDTYQKQKSSYPTHRKIRKQASTVSDTRGNLVEEADF